MRTVLLLAFILVVLLQKVSNEEILTELNKILEKIPIEEKGSTRLVKGFVSFDSVIIDRVEKGKRFPIETNASFEEKFKNEQFSVGHYTGFHFLDFSVINEADNYLFIGTLDKDDPKYIKFVLIKTKVRVVPPVFVFFRRGLVRYLNHVFLDCFHKCKKRFLFLHTIMQRNKICLRQCHAKKQITVNGLKYKMSLEVKEVLKKKFATTAFRTQILNYFNKGIFQTENIFKILKTELQKIETALPGNLFNYVLNTDVFINYVSDVTPKGDYSKYNLDNAIKAQLEMLEFVSQVDLQAFSFEAHLSTGEYEQIIGVGFVDPNDQNLVHLTFFQARAKSKLRQQYNYPYPACTENYYKSNLQRIVYPKAPFLNKKLFPEYFRFFKNYPRHCFMEERGFLPSEILVIKTGMKNRIYEALKNKIEKAYVK